MDLVAWGDKGGCLVGCVSLLIVLISVSRLFEFVVSCVEWFEVGGDKCLR